MQIDLEFLKCFYAIWLNYSHFNIGGENVTKRNIKTKSGLQSAKSLTSAEFANEMNPQNKKAKKSKPNT